MQELQVIEVKGQRVLTTRQLAEAYQTTTDTIKVNFSTNRCRFIEQGHYIYLKGEELKQFKNEVRDSYLVANRASHLYLWTEKGALLHAKSLNTDKAWEVYEYLLDFYFRAKADSKLHNTSKNEIIPTIRGKELIPEGLPDKRRIPVLPEMHNPIKIFNILYEYARLKGLKVKSGELRGYKSMLKNNKVAIRNNMTLEEISYELVYELAHAMVHHNAGNIIDSPLRRYYDEQAERISDMVIELLNVAGEYSSI